MAAKHFGAAEAELELRAAEATLRGELLGEAQLLGLIRDALDRYVEACKAVHERPESEWPPNRAVGYCTLAAGYELMGWHMTARSAQPVRRYPSRSSRIGSYRPMPMGKLDVGNAALMLHFEVHDTPERARRLLAHIERSIQKVSA